MAAVLDGGLYARDGEGRAFALAVGASIVLHALILFVAPNLFQPPKAHRVVPGPIVARLAQPAAAAPPPAAAPAETPQPRTEDPPPPPPLPQAKPQPAPSTKPAAVPAPAPTAKPDPTPTAKPAPSTPAPSRPATSSSEAPRPSEAAPAASASTSTAPAAKPEPAPPVQAPTAPAPAVDPSNAATLSQYRIAIITAAKRFKRYPRTAMDNNWEGKVEIRMVIGANGMISSIGIKTGTGFDILDAQALDMIRKAKPMVMIPPALGGKEFTVDVPVIFSLKEETG